MITTFGILLTCLILDRTGATEVKCERIVEEKWNLVGWQNTCRMTRLTSINNYEVTIMSPRDETVGALTFWGNRKILNLPTKVAEVFPNLVFLDAEACSLTVITKEYFKNMGKLRRLDLDRNRIERIPSNAFNDLVSLEEIDLRKQIRWLAQIKVT